MQAVINPGNIKGTLKAPSSKSMMQRACAAALLHRGKTIIKNPGHSDDDRTALNIIQQLGATIVHKDDGEIEIESSGIHPKSTRIDCGESGLSARLFIPISSLSDRQMEIYGSGSLVHRTMEEFGTILPKLGVELEGFNGHLPFKVKGPLGAKNISINGDISSQFLSGLLFAFAYSVKESVTIEVANLKSKPYIDLSLGILEQFGKKINHSGYKEFCIDPALFKDQNEVVVSVEGDWSNAAFWLVAGATTGSVIIEGLDKDSLQADKAILNVLEMAGASVQIKEEGVQVNVSSLRSFDFDATDCPDLFPALAILAGKCPGESYIHGIHRLWHKESNRIESITEMLHQFGIFYSIEDDMLCIRNRVKFDYATIDSYNDHRIAMAASIGALHAKGQVVILEAECVNKSYPDFYKDLISLGVTCDLNNV